MSYLEQRELLRSPPERHQDRIVSLALIICTLLFNLPTMRDGLFFDDHWYRAMIRSSGWGYLSQVESCSFELPGHIAKLWWQDHPLKIRHARPVAMLILKTEYLLTGGYPPAMHLLSILWHAATAVMVFHLVRWLHCERRWAFLAGAVFILNPQAVFTVGWISAQHAIISTCLLTAAILAYASASTIEATRRSRRSHVLYQVGWSQVRIGWLVLAIVLWGLSLFCHEVAIVFPLLVMLLDAGYGRSSLLLYRLPIHAVLWSLALAYSYWRWVIFIPSSVPMPWELLAPHNNSLSWGTGKLVQLLFSVMCWTPMFMDGILSGDWLSNHLLIDVAVLFVMGAILAWYRYASGELRCRFLWPIWIVAGLVPTIPMFTLPCFSYLPFVAYAIMMTIMLRRLPSKPRLILLIGMFVVMIGLGGIYRSLWRAIIQSEQLIISDITSTTPIPEPGCQVFFINLPVVAIHTPAALREAYGLQDLATPPDMEGHILTLAPHPLVMDQPSVVEQLNDFEILVSTPAPGYFSGPTQSILLDYTRKPENGLYQGLVVEGNLFDTTIVEADDKGIRKLRFKFHLPLSSPHFYFYICSSERPAYRRLFEFSQHPMAEEHVSLFANAQSDNPDIRNRARRQLARMALPLAIQLGDPIQNDLDDTTVPSNQALGDLEKWWHAVNASQLIMERERWLADHKDRLMERDKYFSLAGLAQCLLQADLFLPAHLEATTSNRMSAKTVPNPDPR